MSFQWKFIIQQDWRSGQTEWGWLDLIDFQFETYISNDNIKVYVKFH